VKILLCSYAFAPSIGGIETVSAILAEEFTKLGATVVVVTNTMGEQVSAGYQVVRCPSLPELIKLSRSVDVIFQNNISLKTLLPLLLFRRPIFVTHQTWITNVKGGRGWAERLKILVLPFCRNIAISQAIAYALPVKSPVIIGNPFDPLEFTVSGENVRDKDIVFLGRLVSSKGCDLVLRALAILKAEGNCPSFSIIGDWPELHALEQLSSDLGLSSQVAFRGAMRSGRGREVMRHKIMVVPSTWEEPFGVVALEGIAAGCVIVASRTGGLPEAVGPCGIFFPKGDVVALASTLKGLLADGTLQRKLTREGWRHLQQFQPNVIAVRYMETFRSAPADGR
jgi:glycogen synthase